MDAKDLLTIGDVAHRSGFPPSALRYYEREGLLRTPRTSGGQRRSARSVLRGAGAAPPPPPDGRPRTKADWARLSRAWRSRLDEQIEALVALRDGLDSCIGC